MEAIINDLKTYFDSVGEEYNENLLTLFTNQSILNVVNKRYPFGCDEDEKEAAITKFRNVIFNAVLYAYNHIGAEFEATHNENGINRSWINEADLYSNIVPVAKVIHKK